MPATALKYGSRVITLDRLEFRIACMELLRLAIADFRPNLIVGIPSGGMHVASAMLEAAPHLPVCAVTSRRPSTRHKTGAGIKTLVRVLPRAVQDQLRVMEHSLLAGRSSQPAGQTRELDQEELARLQATLQGLGTAPAILVVDDAVDSGATLAAVMDAVTGLAPPTAVIRSAAITQTTDRPLRAPDYALYDQLCRFPWSLDA